MKKFKTEELAGVLAEIGIRKNDSLFVHSRLFDFGIPSDAKIRELPQKIAEGILQKIGPSGTLVVPVFNFDFCRGKPFDRQETPADTSIVGVFSEYVRNLPEARRSFDPMQSVAAVGQSADYLVERDTESAFSSESPFDRFGKLDGKILLVGASVSNVSFIHYVEEKNAVPYRYWKNFRGSYTDNKITSEKTYKMYVRDLAIQPELRIDTIEKELKKQGKLKEAKWGGGIIQAFKIKDFLNIADYLIKRNPYYFIKNHPTFERF